MTTHHKSHEYISHAQALHTQAMPQPPMNKHALAPRGIHNPVDQNKVKLADMFYVQLAFLYHDATNQYADQHAQSLHHQAPKSNEVHHAPQDAEAQS